MQKKRVLSLILVAFAAVRTGRFADETRVNELHAGKIRITERGHDLEKVVLFGEFRGRTGGELIVDGLILVKRRDVHLKVAPLVALFFAFKNARCRSFFAKRLVDVDEFELAELSERRQEEVPSISSIS